MKDEDRGFILHPSRATCPITAHNKKAASASMDAGDY
jgi:hypothetical protein